MAIAAANGIDTYYQRGGVGDAPPLLFISGTGGDLRRKPNAFDGPLARAFDLLCYDQRGLGQTSKPPGPYSMAQYADDAAALLDALEIDDVAVMGVSFGGMVAQELTLRHPGRVRALVLACTSSGGGGGASFPLDELQTLEPRARAEAQLRVSDLRHTDEWIAANPDAWNKRMDMALSAQGSAGDSTEDAAGAAAQLAARRGHDTWQRLPELNLPVLLAGGQYDGIAPKENMQALHQRIAGSELRFFDGGHLFLLQDRSAYRFVIDWLDREG